MMSTDPSHEKPASAELQFNCNWVAAGIIRKFFEKGKTQDIESRARKEYTGHWPGAMQSNQAGPDSLFVFCFFCCGQGALKKKKQKKRRTYLPTYLFF
jgi:hypothetical protein